MARYEASQRSGKRRRHDDRRARSPIRCRPTAPARARSALRSREPITPAASCSTISRKGRGDRLALTGPAGHAQLCRTLRRSLAMGPRLSLARTEARRPHPDVPRRYAGLSGGIFRRGARRLRAAVDQYADAAGPAAVLSVGFRRHRRRRRRRVLRALRRGGLQGHAIAHADRRQRRGRRSRRAECHRRSTWLPDFPADLAEADTHRNEMAFWMYSSGSTGRPKGIVHLQHDMAYSEAAFARNVLKLKPDDICFSVPKMFFAYGFGNSITFPFSAGAATLLLPGQPKPAAIFEAIERFRPTRVFRIADALYVADQGRGRGGHGFFLAADGAVGRRSAVGRGLQRLEDADRPRDRRGAGLDRSAAHLSLQPPGAEKARRRRASRARL